MMRISETLFKKYISEREGKEIIENDLGFIIYKITQQECFIADMHVVSRSRRKGIGNSLFNQLYDLAKESKCKVITANIHLEDKNASNTLAASLKWGFKVQSCGHNILLIIKEIQED